MNASSTPRRLFPRLFRSHLIALAILTVSNGCGTPPSEGEAESYIENGALWAYGSIQLAELDGPGTVMLKRLAPVQGVDASTWSLYGAVLAGDERDLAYADFHPTTDRLLAYSYQLEVVRRANGQEVFDIFSVLRKAGRSYYQRQRVFLGTAAFNGNDTAAVTLAPNLKLSLIANGVFAGQWALHYPDVQKIVVKPWQGMCMRTPTQSPGQGPGQNPGQTPGQFDTCRPLPPEKDLCGGDPTQAACRPNPPVQQPGTIVRPDRIVSGLEPQGNDVYVLGADTREGKLVFVSDTLAAADDEANAALCAKKFFAVARTVNGRVNQACLLTPAPAAPVDGKAACGLTVRFETAQTYLERVCDVTALFKGVGGTGAAEGLDNETQKVQVLKR